MKKTIVLAEDYLDFHEFFERGLSKHYKIIFFENGLECYNFIKETTEKIDLILTDFDMPKMNGGQLAKKLQEDGCKIPVVLMSMHIPEAERIKIGDEVRAVLDKPKMFINLAENIKQVFERIEVRGEGQSPS